jgi:hypothetical protein
MFLLLGTTFLELSAFLIIVFLIFKTWTNISLGYKLTAVLGLLVTGTFFINDLTILASINPTTTSAQKIVVSPKEQDLKDQLKIKLYPYNKLYLTETITLKPQDHLSINDHQLIKDSFSKDTTMAAKLQVMTKTDNLIKYRVNQFSQNTDISQDMIIFEKNIHLNNPKKLTLKNATLTLTTVKIFKTTYTNHSQGFLHTNKKN